MKNFLPLFLIVLSISSYSQSFMGITIGSSIPISDYRDISSKNDNTGYGETGYSIAIDGAYFLSDTIGIGLSFGINGHYGVDVTAWTNEIAGDSPASTIAISSDLYSITTFMVGPYFNNAIGDKLNFNLKLLAGLFIATSPAIIVFVDGIIVTFTPASTGTFTVLFGAGLDYLISDKVSLGLMAETTIANPEFEYVFGAGTVKVEQPMNILNFGVNLKFRPFN